MIQMVVCAYYNEPRQRARTARRMVSSPSDMVTCTIWNVFMYLSNYAMIPVQSQYRIFRLFLDFGVFSFHFESPLVRKDFSLLKKKKRRIRWERRLSISNNGE